MDTTKQPDGGQTNGADLVLDAVAQWAERTPEATAVTAPDGTLTFAELAATVREMAAALLAAGARPGLTVGLGFGRSRLTVPALLAVWRVGAAAVPVDSDHPVERLEFQLRDADIRLLLGSLPPGVETDAETVDLSATDGAPALCENPVGPRDCAYLVYTSGTTGRPKGAEIGYGALGTFLAAVATFGLRPGGLGFNPLSPAFDGWLWCTLLYLLHGQGVALTDPPLTGGGTADLADAIAVIKPRTVCLSPSLLAACPADMPSVEVMVVAGEACPPALAKRLAQRHRLVNVYGPTETTIAATWADSAAGDDVLTIGRAMLGYTTHVLDVDRNPVDTGIDGELYVGGPAVALRYRNRPGLTAARFVPDPFAGPGAVMYRTGDLVRRRPDGQLEFRGRIDDQVKVRGFRVELAEVEHTAVTIPDIQAAAAFVLSSGDALGLAVVPCAGAEPSACIEKALAQCRGQLPHFMVPSVVRAVTQLPTTPSGKADREALADLETDEVPAQTGREPSTHHERLVCEVWSSVLPQRVTSVDADFFASGGHSLLASRVVSRLRKETGLRVSIRELLTHPTVGAFARELDRVAEETDR